MANERTVRAVVKIEELNGARHVINTTVVADSIESLKRKVIGIIDLMDEGDLEGGQ